MTKPNLLRAIAVGAAIFLGSVQSFAQGQTPAPPPSPGGQGGGQSGGQAPRNTPQQLGRVPDTTSRMIYISGKVLLADGTAPPTGVAIERVCNGIVRPEGYTDSRGNFSFQLGGQSGLFYEASMGTDPFSQEPLSGVGGARGVSEREVIGCEIRANLAGFISDVVPLGFRRSLDDPDIGIIHIHPLEKVAGFTFSVTTAAAQGCAQRLRERREESREAEMGGCGKGIPEGREGVCRLRGGLVRSRPRLSSTAKI
jgi:hypothetical protein